MLYLKKRIIQKRGVMMLLSVALISVVGFLICLYGFFIERKVKADQKYKAICDLSDHVSCTKTFLSPWGSLFGISNIQLGLVAYFVMFLVALIGKTCLAFLLATGFMIATIFFAYILFTKVKTFCLICVSTYIVNLILFIVTYYYM
jgi:vitamin-K-epoxide reductase (warfarin-sensitive)